MKIGSMTASAKGLTKTGAFYSWGNCITHLLNDGKQKKPIIVLDGVRAIACLSIVVFHVNFALNTIGIPLPTFRGLRTLTNALAIAGQCGVVLFFVLSGFLLFFPYAKALLLDSTWPSPLQFYLRRIFRIVPAYYAALFLIILLFNRQYLQFSH